MAMTASTNDCTDDDLNDSCNFGVSMHNSSQFHVRVRPIAWTSTVVHPAVQQTLVPTALFSDRVDVTR